mmetsp:Transcript_33875/g.106236  ORF Transcript_33875/g.106236 Transcript_33875/m.106236 type:complete len:344 (+) Transcript_33875:144-1175(+)
MPCRHDDPAYSHDVSSPSRACCAEPRLELSSRLCRPCASPPGARNQRENGRQRLGGPRTSYELVSVSLGDLELCHLRSFNLPVGPHKLDGVDALEHLPPRRGLLHCRSLEGHTNFGASWAEHGVCQLLGRHVDHSVASDSQQDVSFLDIPLDARGRSRYDRCHFILPEAILLDHDPNPLHLHDSTESYFSLVHQGWVNRLRVESQVGERKHASLELTFVFIKQLDSCQVVAKFRLVPLRQDPTEVWFRKTWLLLGEGKILNELRVELPERDVALVGQPTVGKRFNAVRQDLLHFLPVVLRCCRPLRLPCAHPCILSLQHLTLPGLPFAPLLLRLHRLPTTLSG